MIVTCKCPHAEQDRMYGIQRRVANLKKGGDFARCTVCKAEIRVREKEAAKPAEEAKK